MKLFENGALRQRGAEARSGSAERKRGAEARAEVAKEKATLSFFPISLCCRLPKAFRKSMLRPTHFN